MRPTVRDEQLSFAGGVNLVADDLAMGETQVRRLENGRLTVTGAVQKRRGTQRLLGATFASQVQGGIRWARTVGGPVDIVAAGGRLWTLSRATAPATAAQLIGVLNPAVPVQFAAFRDGDGECLYFADGGRLGKVTASGVVSRVAVGPLSITALWVYNQRLFALTGTDATVWVSGLNNGDTLGVSASDGVQAVVRTFGDANLTAGIALGQVCLLFHETGISAFTGTTQDDIAIAAGAYGVTSDVGTIAPRSVVSLESSVLFLSDRGVYSVGAGAGPQPVSTLIEPALAGLPADVARNVVAVHHRTEREVWFVVPDAGAWVYSYRLQAWAGPWTGAFLSPQPTALWETQDASGRPMVLMGAADGTLVRADGPGIYRDNVLADETGGVPFTMQAELRPLWHGSAYAEKAYRWAHVVADMGGVSSASVAWRTRWSTDERLTDRLQDTSPTRWGTGEWGTGVWGLQGLRSYSRAVHGRGTSISLTLIDSSEAEALYSRIGVTAFAMNRELA
jgi:hypothetical protein